MKEKPKKLTRKKQHALLLDANRHRYAEMLAEQGGGCAICGRIPKEGRKLDMDHDHKTMKVRGLLCHLCNRALATWMTPEWLGKAWAYLRRYK